MGSLPIRKTANPVGTKQIRRPVTSMARYPYDAFHVAITLNRYSRMIYMPFAHTNLLPLPSFPRSTVRERSGGRRGEYSRAQARFPTIVYRALHVLVGIPNRHVGVLASSSSSSPSSSSSSSSSQSSSYPLSWRDYANAVAPRVEYVFVVFARPSSRRRC